MGTRIEGDAADAGKAPPVPSVLEKLRRRKAWRGWTWGVVDVDIGKLSVRSTRINVALPERLLDTIDRHARARGETRSGFLARAAIEALSRDAA